MLTAIGHPQTSYLSIDQHFLQVQVDSVHHHWKSLMLPAFNPGIIFSEAEARERHYVLIMERLFSDHGFHQVHKALKGTEYLQHTKYLLYTMIQYDSWRFYHQQSSTFQINMSSCPQNYIKYREQRPVGSNFINKNVESPLAFFSKALNPTKKWLLPS